MTFIKRMLGLCGLTASLALASGCSDYTYFNVGVYLNQDSGDNMVDRPILEDMTTCTVAVYIGDNQIEHATELTTGGSANGICKPGFNGQMGNVGNTKVMKVGVLDYSSARTSGEIKFTVTVLKPGGDKMDVMAQGSASASVSSGKVLEVPLIVNACAYTDHPSGQKDCRNIN
jgi:hypothetical protein